jgi:uncharacterized HhH-GPD family protein
MTLERADHLFFTEDEAANALLASDPMALLIGFVLDQQVSVLKAFSGPLELKRRIGSLDARAIAEMSPAALEEAFRRQPALHRFPGSMARRTQELARAVTETYGGDAARIWLNARDGRDLLKRLLDLPGIGAMKAGTIVGVLGRRLGIRPSGWEGVAPHAPTLADVDSAETLSTYRAGKAAAKARLREEAAAHG